MPRLPRGLRPRPGAGRRVLVVLMVAALAGIGAIAGVAALNRTMNPTTDHPAAVEPAPVVPLRGQSGASTCTDPVARQQWRVTWKVTSGPTSSSAATNTVAAQAGATDIVATGFAVRSLPGPAPSRPSSSPPDLPSPSSGPPTPSPGPTPTYLPAVAIQAASTAGSSTAESADNWQSRNLDLWALRWSPTLAEAMAAAPGETYERKGPLSTLALVKLDVGNSPRYVTPDGSCTVFIAPFVSAGANDSTVAVLGDSLVAQLYASQDGTISGTGELLGRLEAGDHRTEINGQAGRRWTVAPGSEPASEPGLERADVSMLDEIRGLRAARSMVIALGTNDAGWVALAPDAQQYQLRLAWVLLHLAPMLDELDSYGHCTVLVTMAERNKRYIDTPPGRFDDAARRINAYLHQRADANPHDRLKIWDWGAHADPHGTFDPQPWFGSDTIHLNSTGRAAYADDLTRAAALC